MRIDFGVITEDGDLELLFSAHLSAVPQAGDLIQTKDSEYEIAYTIWDTTKNDPIVVVLS